MQVFELLKLIRDGELTSIAGISANPSAPFSDVRFYVEKWRDVGLVELDGADNVRPLPLLAEVVRSLRISLTKLSPYHATALVSVPLFGQPREAPSPLDIFVLMPFAQALKPVYDDHIHSIARKMELTAARADDFFTASSIITDIWNALNECKIVIGDCTGRNPNVFYELGIAHTLGKPTILIAQSTDDIPFDLQHLRVIIYEFTPRGMRDFETRLQETIKHQLTWSGTLADGLKRYFSHVRQTEEGG